MNGPANSAAQHRQRTPFLVGALRRLGGRRGFHSLVGSREEEGSGGGRHISGERGQSAITREAAVNYRFITAPARESTGERGSDRGKTILLQCYQKQMQEKCFDQRHPRV